MKVKFANRIYEVLYTKKLAGLTMYAVEDEPHHIDWLINVELVDVEKKEFKKIEDEEYNGEDYGIDGLWHAKNILEKTLGKVSGYQTDDGILSHQCAITAIKKLYEQKPTDEDMKEALRAEYEKGRVDVIADTLSWLANCWPQYCDNPNIIKAFEEAIKKDDYVKAKQEWKQKKIQVI